MSRHLDDKAAVATLLEMLTVLGDHQEHLEVPMQVLITVSEEVGIGASH